MHAEKKASLLEFSMKLDFTRSQFSWQLYDCKANISFMKTQNSLLLLSLLYFFCVFVGVLTHFLFHLFTNLFFVLSLFFPTNFCASLCYVQKLAPNRTRCPMIGKSTPTSLPVAFATIVAAFCTAYRTKASNVHVYFISHHTSFISKGVSHMHLSFFLQPVIWMYTRNARNQCQTCVDAIIPSEEEGPIWKFIARGINSFAQVLNYHNYCLLD